MILEVQAAQHPDAIAGRALLRAKLNHLSPAEQEVFYPAVRSCFSSRAPAAANEKSRGRSSLDVKHVLTLVYL